MTKDQNPYNDCKIRDIHLASYLSSLGFNPTISSLASSQNSPQGQKITFDFGEIDQDVVLSYFDKEFVFKIGDREYTTSPKKVFSAFKRLSRQLYDARKV